MNTIKGTAEVTFDVGGIVGRIVQVEAAVTRLLMRLGEPIDDYGLGIAPFGVIAAQDARKAIDKDIWDLGRPGEAQNLPCAPVVARQAELPMPASAPSKKVKRVGWTKEELKTLRRLNDDGASLDDMTKALPRHNPGAIYQKSRDLGYRCGGPRFRVDRGIKVAPGVRTGMWGADEDRVLGEEANGGVRNPASIAATIKAKCGTDRTPRAVYSRAQKLGYTTVDTPRPYTPARKGGKS